MCVSVCVALTFIPLWGIGNSIINGFFVHCCNNVCGLQLSDSWFQ